MFKIKRPGFLVLPAYLIGIAVLVYALNAMTPPYSGLLATAMILALATPVTLIHRKAPNDSVDIVVYCIVFMGTILFAAYGPFAGPTMITKSDGSVISVWQVGLVVAQQVLYFGLHAFLPEKK